MCWLEDDATAFWFDHDCDSDVARWARGEGFKSETRLPLGPDGWQVVQREPLTIAPSILCGQCGLHGFWREGRWQSA